MKTVLLFIIFGVVSVNAQLLVSGKVLDPAGRGIEGANVYLEGTYDGANTSTDGSFFSPQIRQVSKFLLFLSFLSRLKES